MEPLYLSKGGVCRSVISQEEENRFVKKKKNRKEEENPFVGNKILF